jgi:hypothetical protein
LTSRALAARLGPDAIATYCLPLTSNVIGGAEKPEPRYVAIILPDPRQAPASSVCDEMFNIMTKANPAEGGHRPSVGRVLVLLVLSCAVMLVPPLWTAAVDIWQVRPSGQECSALKDAAAKASRSAESAGRAARIST